MHDELQGAIRHHAEWHRRLIRTLVCRLPSEPDDGQVEPHRACGFGQWHYHQAQHDLRGRPEYASIEAAHRRLHRLAAQLLLEMAGRESVSIGAFDQFVAESHGCASSSIRCATRCRSALRSRDALTGAYRRIEILPALREARELGARGVQPSCVAFMDLDRFKDVNDSHGHGVGDEVLAGAARYVAAHLRTYDRVFRYGGDEFLMLLPGTDPEGAHLVDRLRAGLAGVTLGTTPAGAPIRVTASFGVTPLGADLTVEECIDRADKALLLAKAAGRNRVVCWDRRWRGP